MRTWLLATALLAGSCHPHHAAHPRSTSIQSCSYDVALSRDGRVRVSARCKANGPLAFRPSRPLPANVLRASTRPVHGRYAAERGELSYQVDLARLANHRRDFDRAVRFGDSFFAPMSNVLLVPEPLTTEIPVRVRVRAEAPLEVAVGLARDEAPDQYRLMAHEIPVATYFAFGKLQRRTLDIDHGTLELTRVDGSLDVPFDRVARWVSVSARAVSDFYGVFPVARASVTVLPIPERKSVLFGKVLPESEPGVALLLGQHVNERELYADWILVHELFHLGFPSFFEEGKWLDEGLATYYEPIIRARAGLYSETALWDEFESSMSQGVPAFTGSGLEQARDFRGIYWGGAIACLVADVEARRRKQDVGLEVGLRALRDAGANACEVWTLSEVIGVVDRALGAPTLAPIAAAHAKHGSDFDLHGLFAALGVTRSPAGHIVLSDSAPLAAVRRAITRSR